jgi:hypothetical protein
MSTNRPSASSNADRGGDVRNRADLERYYRALVADATIFDRDVDRFFIEYATRAGGKKTDVLDTLANLRSRGTTTPEDDSQIQRISPHYVRSFAISGLAPDR